MWKKNSQGGTSSNIASKHFHTDAEKLVLDNLKALTILKPNLVLSEKDKFIFNSRYNPESYVAVISGGGAGHEPAHAAFVGAGMLSCAISGSVFASPSTQQITNALKQVSGPKGAVIIVKNYTGDVLHFGLAATKHTAATGQPVEVVVVGDDVSVPRSQAGKVGRRGIAGTILIHKIAGAMTSTRPDFSAETVADYLHSVADGLVSIGATLEHVHIPGREQPDAEAGLEGDEMELGMGIHNEPGCKKLKPLPTLPDLIKEMLDQCLDMNDKERAFVDFSTAEKVVLMVNNLGGLSSLELGGVLNEVHKQLGERKIVPVRIFFGTYMTSLDARGFSISLLRADEDMIKLLDLPTKTMGWTPGVDTTLPRGGLALKDLPEGMSAISIKGQDVENEKTVDVHMFESVLKKSLNNLIAAEPIITKYDTVVGDGDCGTTLKRGAEAILSHYSSNSISASARENLFNIAQILESNTDGTIGFIMTLYLHSLASSLPAKSDGSALTAAEWAKAASEALERMKRYTPAEPGDRTMMDALTPFVTALNESGADVRKAMKAAKDGMEKTKGMSPALGRAVYVNKSGWDEVPDPGAVAVHEIVKGFGEIVRPAKPKNLSRTITGDSLPSTDGQ